MIFTSRGWSLVTAHRSEFLWIADNHASGAGLRPVELSRQFAALLLHIGLVAVLADIIDRQLLPRLQSDAAHRRIPSRHDVPGLTGIKSQPPDFRIARFPHMPDVSLACAREGQSSVNVRIHCVVILPVCRVSFR